MSEAQAVVDAEDLIEQVLLIVEQIPAGRVTTYGAIGSAVGRGPRWVGNVMARHGGPVPWWRVVRADGSPPPCHEGTATDRYDDEGTPSRASGKVDMAVAFWTPATPEASLSAADRGRSRPD